MASIGVIIARVFEKARECEACNRAKQLGAPSIPRPVRDGREEQKPSPASENPQDSPQDAPQSAR